MRGAPSRAVEITDTNAWAFAMTWRYALQSVTVWHQRVRLKTETMSGDPFAVVETYAWVKIKVDTRHEAAIARAATLVWFWLSCCRGYSGRENPVFWKRVFADLQLEQPNQFSFEVPIRTPTKYSPITDATRFFDRHEFPRVRLKVGDVDVCRVFLGLSSDDATARQLGEIQAQLRPYMLADRLSRHIPVRIEMNDLSEVPGITAVLREASLLLPHDPIARSQVDSVLVHAWVSYLPGAQNLCLTDAHVVVKTLEMTAKDSLVDRTNLQPLFQQRKSRRNPTARVQTLCLRRESMPTSLLASVCSALPHSQTFSVLRIMAPVPNVRYASRNRGLRIKDLDFRPLDCADWAWLGYAIFHPDSKDSTWHHIDVNVDSITPDAVQIVRSMASGNNLVATKQHSQSAYVIARLRCHAPVYSEPALEATRLYKTETSVWASECPDPSASLEDWIRIVAPGYGFGWVHASAVTERRSRPSGESCLRGLRLHVTVPSQLATALEFVAVVGTNLEQLDLSNCGILASSELHRLCFALPKLKSLTVHHDSSLWSVPLGPASTLPKLEELSMILDGETQHEPHGEVLGTILHELQALRIITHTQCFARNRAAALVYLQALPNLSYFHWSDPEARRRSIYHGRSEDVYRKGRVDTRKQLGRSFGVARNARCRHAFLSVLDVKRVQNPFAAISRVDPDICALIFSFGPLARPMELWVGA